MSLLNEPFGFAYYTDNLSGTVSTSTIGTNFTAGGNNADGSSTTIVTALTHDCHRLVLGFSSISAGAVDSNCLADVLVDPSGGTSWTSRIDDLICGFTPVQVNGQISVQMWYDFPIWIKSGSSIGIRARTAHSANITTCRVQAYVFGQPSRADAWWCGTAVESLGVNPSTSRGVDVTAGNANSFGSWSTIGTSTVRYGAVQVGIQGSDSNATVDGYYFQLGTGSSRFPGMPTFYHCINSSEGCARNGHNMFIPADIAAGTGFQMRGACDGTAEVFNGAVYGVY